MTDERQHWGGDLGIPEGSDFTLEAKLTVNGVTDTSRVTSSGTFTLWISDSVLNGGTALLSNEAADSVATTTGVVKWEITDAQSSGWEGGLYNGDVKGVDSASNILIWPVSIRIREPRSS